MANIFSIGISGLTASQTRLATTGHNIANVNTEGYSRQRVGLETLPAQQTSLGAIGNGVQISGVRRSYDDFLADRVRTASASSSEAEYLYSRAVQVDNVIADPAAGMSKTLGDFFNAVHDVADDPTSVTARDVMLNQGEVLSNRFHGMDTYFGQLRDQANTDMATYAGEMNRITSAIAGLNERIQSSGLAHGASQPNDLLDTRDRLIDELNQYVSVKTVQQSDGQVNVFTGNGQALVLGTGTNTLEVEPSALAADQRTLYLRTPDGNRLEVSDLVRGGKMGGLLRFQQEVLNPAQDALGMVAVGLAGFFNEQHSAGMDQDGNLGGDFFGLADPQLLGHANNAGTASVSFTDLSQVRSDEYDLRYDGASWQLIRASDNQVVPMTGSGTAADPFQVDGVSIVITSAPAAGDRYLLRPTRGGAADFDMLIKNTRDIAAADPVRTAAASGNTGSGSIGSGALEKRTGSTKLAAPITLSYDAAAKQFNLSSGGSIAYDATMDSGKKAVVSIAGLGDFSFTLNGKPADGDQFLLADNTGGVGDNRNARQLAALQTDKVLFGGSASVTGAYGTAVADVGTVTSRALNGKEVQKQLMNQAVTAKDALTGVNLDEEAANLLQFQQAYQASAQVISAANNMIQTLLGIVT